MSGWRRRAYNPPDGTARRFSQAWTTAEASKPLDWSISGIYRFGDLWIALAEGLGFEDYASGSGQYAEQAPGALPMG